MFLIYNVLFAISLQYKLLLLKIILYIRRSINNGGFLYGFFDWNILIYTSFLYKFYFVKKTMIMDNCFTINIKKNFFKIKSASSRFLTNEGADL